MRDFMKNKPLLIAVVAVVLLLILALASSGDRTLTWVESTIGGIFKPVQTFSSQASGSIINFFQRMFNTTDADKENQQLKVYIAQLEENVSELETLRSENERLKGLLNFTEAAPDLTYVSGLVIGRSQGIWFDTFTINVGRNQGVEKNMPVVNAEGLVGRVTEVGLGWSKVTAVIDGTMNVSVMVERTRDNCMVRGTLKNGGEDSNYLELYYLASDADLQPGDRIVTAGTAGIYPKGILIGEVVEVSRSGENASYNALIAPAADFKHIEEIMVIAGMPDHIG